MVDKDDEKKDTVDVHKPEDSNTKSSFFWDSKLTIYFGICGRIRREIRREIGWEGRKEP